MADLSFLRKRFGFVMVALVLVVCAILLIRQKVLGPAADAPLAPIQPSTTIPLTPIDPVELRAEWQRSITSILEDYDKTGDARAAKERLLAVRAPASGKDAHLALFLALNSLSESRPEGKMKLAEARATFLALSATPASSATTTTTSSTR